MRNCPERFWKGWKLSSNEQLEEQLDQTRTVLKRSDQGVCTFLRTMGEANSWESGGVLWG